MNYGRLGLVRQDHSKCENDGCFTIFVILIILWVLGVIK